MRVYTFHRGLRLDVPEWELGEGEVPELINFVFGDNDGLLRKRRGLSRIVSTEAQADKPVLGLCRASVGGTNPHTLVVVNGTVYRVQDTSPSWEQIHTGLWSTARVRFDTWKDKVFLANGVDELYAWDGTTMSKVDDAPAGCKFVQQFSDRLFIASSAQFPDTLFYSDLLDPETWEDPETEIPNILDVSPGDDQRITGIKRTRQQLTIFKSHSTYYLLGYDPEEWVLRRVSDSVGCVAPDSIVEMDGRTIWLSSRGVYMDDGTHFYRIGGAIQPFIETLTADQLAQAVATTSGWLYILIFPSTPTDGCVSFAYHVRNEAWVRWNLGEAIGAVCSKNLPSDNGGWVAGHASKGLIYHGESGGTDDGKDIAARLRLPLVGQQTPEAQLDLRRVALDASVDEDDEATLAWSVDGAAEVTREFTGSRATIYSTPAGTLGQRFSVAVEIEGSGTGSFVRGIAAEVRVKRRRW